MKKLVLLIPTLALVGCASVPTDAGRIPGYAVPGTTEGGCVFGSIGKTVKGAEAAPFGWTNLVYGPQGAEDAELIRFGHNGIADTPIDHETDSEVSAVFRVCLKPGAYELRNVRFYYNNGAAEKTFFAQEPFSIPFAVEQGQSLYIGRFIARGVTGENMFGMPIPAGGYFTVEDASEQDWKAVAAKYPAVPERPTVAIVQPEGHAAHFVAPRGAK